MKPALSLVFAVGLALFCLTTSDAATVKFENGGYDADIEFDVTAENGFVSGFILTNYFVTGSSNVANYSTGSFELILNGVAQGGRTAFFLGSNPFEDTEFFFDFSPTIFVSANDILQIRLIDAVPTISPSGFATTPGEAFLVNSTFERLSSPGTDVSAPIPLPTTLPLLLAGIGGLAAMLHRRNTKSCPKAKAICASFFS